MDFQKLQTKVIGGGEQISGVWTISDDDEDDDDDDGIFFSFIINLLFGSSDDDGIFLLFHQALGPDD